MDAPTGVDPREGTKRGENYIPWEQIEPLLTPGMRGAELASALIDRLGLPHGEYKFLTRYLPTPRPALIEYLKHGLFLVKVDTQRYPDATEEEVL